MTPILITILTAAVSVVVICLSVGWARLYAHDLKSASEHLELAYGAAHRLIKDPKTPDSVLAFILFFSARAGTPYLARRFAHHLITGRFASSTMSAEARRFSADLEKFDEKQKQNFARFIVAAMVSSAASDPIFSRLYLLAVRTFLSSSGRQDGEPSPERARTVAADFATKTPELCAAV